MSKTRKHLDRFSFDSSIHHRRVEFKHSGKEAEAKSRREIPVNCSGVKWTFFRTEAPPALPWFPS